MDKGKTVEELAGIVSEAMGRSAAKFATRPNSAEDNRSFAVFTLEEIASAIKAAVEGLLLEEVERLQGVTPLPSRICPQVYRHHMRDMQITIDRLTADLAAAREETRAVGQSFEEWRESFVESAEYKADSFLWSDMAKAAYIAGSRAGERQGMERSARIAELEKVEADETEDPSDYLYNRAIGDAVGAIRAESAKLLSTAFDGHDGSDIPHCSDAGYFTVPIMAAQAVLMLSQEPGLTVEEIKNRLATPPKEAP